jgi:hypothetical protein
VNRKALVLATAATDERAHEHQHQRCKKQQDEKTHLRFAIGAPLPGAGIPIDPILRF